MSRPVILLSEAERAEKLKLEQIRENFTVQNAIQIDEYTNKLTNGCNFLSI